MTSGRQWKSVEFANLLPEQLKTLGNVSESSPHAWHTLGIHLFYWNKMDYIVVCDYFTKYLIVRKIPNSSTHSMIKELGMIFRVWQALCAEK